MKLTVNLEKFKNAISLAEKITGKNIDLPILNNIQLETKNGLLNIKATNLEIGIIIKIGAKIDQDGKIIIPAKILNGFITNLSGIKNLNLETENNFLNIVNKNYKTKIKIIKNDEFPIIPQTKKDFLFKVKPSNLKNIIEKLNISVALQDTRPEFTGANLNFKPSLIEWSTTDTFRLSEVIYQLDKDNKNSEYNKFIKKQNSIIIPFNTLLEINRAINIYKNYDNDVNFILDQNQIFVKFNDIEIISRLINGKYPDYHQIIPQKFETEINIDKNRFIQGIHLSSIFNKNELILKSSNEKIILISQEQEIGENENIIKAKTKGKSQEIILNNKYLLDGVKAINNSLINLKIVNSEKPIMIIDTKKNISYNYILMPIKKN